jgi:rhodanese-related sulfurtransferase
MRRLDEERVDVLFRKPSVTLKRAAFAAAKREPMLVDARQPAEPRRGRVRGGMIAWAGAGLPPTR